MPNIASIYECVLCGMYILWWIVFVGANVNTATTSNDHTVLSLACAGGHLSVVQYLLMQNADVGHVLKVCDLYALFC